VIMESLDAAELSWVVVQYRIELPARLWTRAMIKPRLSAREDQPSEHALSEERADEERGRSYKRHAQTRKPI